MDSAIKKRKSAGEIFQEQFLTDQERSSMDRRSSSIDEMSSSDLQVPSSKQEEAVMLEEIDLDIDDLESEMKSLKPEELNLNVKDIPPPPGAIYLGSSLGEEKQQSEDQKQLYDKLAQNLILQFNPFFSSEDSDSEDTHSTSRRKSTPLSPSPGAKNAMPDNKLVTSEELQLEKEPIQVRETGFRFWKRVIVPPNAYVVHTRLGHKEPITLGLGMSFRYNPDKDAYFVVPAAMQTIGIVANCITKERQGINLLAYLQWRIDNFSIAYRKLDFSNPRDPLGIVNAQLREQAEATIKDKIATMGVEEVLTDKAPIIEELTARLKEVTEGRTQEEEMAGEGLGIKIVTVQIREALVSSKSLWQNLQAPYRHQQDKIARISLLTTQNEVRKKEQENRQYVETSEAETTLAIERIKQTKQTEVMTLKLAEEVIRSTKEQETQLTKIQLDEQVTLAKQDSKQRLENQTSTIEQEKELSNLRWGHTKVLEQNKLEVTRQTQEKTLQTEQMLHTLVEETRFADLVRQTQREKLEKELILQQQLSEFELFLQERKDLLAAKEQEASLSRQRHAHLSQLELEKEFQQIKFTQKEKEVALERLAQEARNVINESDLKRRLIEVLPQLLAEMPDIHEFKVLQMNDGQTTLDMFMTSLAKILKITEELGLKSAISAYRSKD